MKDETAGQSIVSTLARRLAAALAIAVLWLGGASAATLAPGVQQRLTGATFEVVLGKPEADPLTYEKPLPLELLPYRERTDKFKSIGTAFAIGQNRFVSAAHVIVAGNGSQYGPMALRDATGKTYRIDRIFKYSMAEDYAVFSVVAAPAVVALETRARPPLNTPVFAVGNAYGEGVVVRDGLYTSDTPEEIDGRWQWLRFSAAASPGNSGGPLIDRNGKVVGVVLRKSPNENLNFALAIGQVQDGSDEFGVLEARSSYRTMLMKAADTVRLDDKIPLPRTLEDFYAASRQSALAWSLKVHADFMKTHGATIFPHGNSEQLLTSVYAEAFPKLIAQSDSGPWMLVGEAPHKLQLDRNGYLQEGTANGLFFVRLRAPDDVTTADLVADSERFMDLLLKGYPLARPVGADSVRVTSMGKASGESLFTDEYRRRWQVRHWLVPFNDTAVITVALPTPDGMVMMMAQSPTVLRESVTRELEELCAFVYASYTGTLAQWRAFLTDGSTLPATLADVELQFDYGRGLAIQSSRFRLKVPAAVQKIEADSVLMLKYSYLRDGADTVWELGGVYLAESEQQSRWIGLVRRPRPPASLPEEFERNWRTMTTAAHPWEGTPFTAGGRTEIHKLVNAGDVVAGRTDVGYALSFSAEGARPASTMQSEFDALVRGFAVLERPGPAPAGEAPGSPGTPMGGL